MIVTINPGPNHIYNDEYKLRLTDGPDSHDIPKDHDISAIKFINLEKNIVDKLVILIGGARILTYEGDEIYNIALPADGILMSKCKYHNIDINIHFTREFIDKHITTSFEPEYNTIEEDTDEWCYVRNPETGEAEYREIVKITKKPTGKTIEVTRRDELINIPSIELTMVPANPENVNARIETPFWEKCQIDPRIDNIENVKHRMNTFKFMLIDNINIEEYYKRKKPFHMYFENKLVYVSNMAGKMFQF
jgi:hypothetical protein